VDQRIVGAGFRALALSAVYSSTKAACTPTRYRSATSFGAHREVLEIAPPWVQTDLLNSIQTTHERCAGAVHRRSR